MVDLYENYMCGLFDREKLDQDLKKIIVHKIQLLAQGERWNSLVRIVKGTPDDIKLYYTKLGKGRSGQPALLAIGPFFSEIYNFEISCEGIVRCLSTNYSWTSGAHLHPATPMSLRHRPRI